MTTVVQSSNSVSSTFLSTLDHLPCDIVRSLWVVQSCNIRAEKEKHKLHELFQKYPYQQDPSPQSSADISEIFPASRNSITQANKESVAELQSLYEQLKTHHSTLKDSLDQLEREIDRKPQDSSVQKNLRQQLKEHYEKNPLTSRVEALQERVLKESGKVIIKRAHGGATGIRIILNSSKKKSESIKSAETGIARSGGMRKELSRVRSLSRASEKPQVSKSSNTTPTYSSAPVKEKNAPVQPLLIEPVEPAVEIYCFCKQPSFGNMIGCDNEKCKNGEWFHYKCVGLLNRVEVLKYAKQKWYCSSQCKQEAESKKARKRRKKSNKW